MIVPGEFKAAYDKLTDLLIPIRTQAETLLRGAAVASGAEFFDVRVKPLESLYLKVEKEGKAFDFSKQDDLVAGTLIVSNKSMIAATQAAVLELFDEVMTLASKVSKPSQFIYDDRHIIVRLRTNPIDISQPPPPVRIEVQIKTRMQLASSAVTRELSYKPKKLSWSRERLASQIRALVEVADDLLQKIEQGESGGSDVESDEMATKNRLIAELAICFGEEELSSDRRRLSDVILKIFADCNTKITIEEFGNLAREDRHQPIREALSLSLVQKTFLILLSSDKLTTSKGNLRGDRCYLITDFMEALCPLAKQVPAARRMLPPDVTTVQG
jgi:ppGpp synthetase/RelA/SpoT-type nucleotidyltranferase